MTTHGVAFGFGAFIGHGRPAVMDAPDFVVYPWWLYLARGCLSLFYFRLIDFAAVYWLLCYAELITKAGRYGRLNFRFVFSMLADGGAVFYMRGVCCAVRTVMIVVRRVTIQMYAVFGCCPQLNGICTGTP